MRRNNKNWRVCRLSADLGRAISVALFLFVSAVNSSAASVSLVIIAENGAVVSNGVPSDVAMGTAFENQSCGTTVSKTFVIQNGSDEPINLSGYRMRGSLHFEVSLVTARLSPGEEQPVKVLFRPEEKTFESGELHLYVEDGEPFLFRLSGSSFDIKPAHGPLDGGNKIRITGELPDGRELTGVRIGENDVEFSQGGGLFSMFRRGPVPINVTLPAAEEPGPVDITLLIAGHEPILLSAIYIYE